MDMSLEYDANDGLSSHTALSHNNMSMTNNTQSAQSAVILKQELHVARRQLADARSSNLFLKKENLKGEHERNLLQI